MYKKLINTIVFVAFFFRFHISYGALRSASRRS